MQTELPWLLYAPFFCANSTFVRADPGSMLVSPGGYAVPTPETSQRFYERLFALYPGSKMAGYEVDFMNDNFLNQLRFRQELGAAEGWLRGMHAAATERAISIQYCMPLPSDLLASLQHPHVTNYRASDDYAGSSITNFNLQTSSLLGWSLGLRPSKDVFFTTDNAPENPYIKRLNEHHPTVPGVDLELNALIATLSTGPVAMGDAAGRTDRALIMRSCTEDGSLLQPNKPLTGIDALYDGRGRPAGGLAAAGGAQVWTTYSQITTASPAAPMAAAAGAGAGTGAGAGGAAVQTQLLLSIDVEGPYTVVDTELDFYPGFDPDAAPHVYIWDHEVTASASKCVNGSAAVGTGCAATTMPALDDSNRPFLQHFDSHKWSLLHVMPVLQNGWVFLGELGSKWVPASGARFSALEATSPHQVGVTAACSADEVLRVGALKPMPPQDGDTGGGEGGRSTGDDWVVAVHEIKCAGASGEQHICIGRC